MTKTSLQAATAKAFLDTTVPCDRILGSKARRAAVEGKLSRYASIATSRFVQLEFALGAYRRLCDFQERTKAATNVTDLLWEAARYAALPPPNRYRRLGQVMINAIFFFIEELEATGPSDGTLLEQLRADLRHRVRRAWRRAFRSVERILDPSACLADLPMPRWDSATGRMTRMADEAYLEQKAGLLAAFIRMERAQFSAILRALATADAKQQDEETRRRVEAIGKILDDQETPTGDDVRDVGDALVAVESPRDHVLLNNNRKHFDPITRAIGKVSESSFDPPGKP
ncbi:MAG: hypothetical protein FJ291_05720 [Planctomycetes bacterium]|nr:hypothetical protein [Planctomycetota bacterium]